MRKYAVYIMTGDTNGYSLFAVTPWPEKFRRLVKVQYPGSWVTVDTWSTPCEYHGVHFDNEAYWCIGIEENR